MIPAHLAIPISDMERAMKFYAALGFVAGEQWERPTWKMVGQMMKHSSGLAIELVTHPDNAHLSRPHTPEVLHVALPVGDVEQTIGALMEIGASIIRPLTEGIKVRRLAFVADPDGNVIELFEPKA